jgi:hypothetical protein
VEDFPEKQSLVEAGRFLTVKDVLKMWPISREYLSRLTNHRDPSKRIPCYRFQEGGRPLYCFGDLMYYRDTLRSEPKQKQRKVKK